MKKVKNAAVRDRVREIIELVEAAATTDGVGDLKKLSGTDDCYRIRVGEYRIGLVIEGDVADSSGSCRGGTSIASSREIADRRPSAGRGIPLRGDPVTARVQAGWRSGEAWVKIMQMIPAIDLRGGCCVRLRQGDYSQETVFGDDPAAIAADWASEGAGRLHLVDLDGAKEGRPINVRAVRAILATVAVPCQLGGGVRDESTIDAWLDAGIDRVIVGTQALKDPPWFRSMAAKYPGRLVLGLDAKDGRVATAGWLDVSTVVAATLAEQFDDLPLAGVVYTDIAKDGMLEGPNLAATEALALRLKTPVIASGGVGTLDDIGRLAGLPIAACIVGRALYDRRFRLSEARERAGDRPPTP